MLLLCLQRRGRRSEYSRSKVTDSLSEAVTGPLQTYAFGNRVGRFAEDLQCCSADSVALTASRALATSSPDR